MTDGFTFNDRALSRTLGTNDPAALAFAQASLGDPNADAVLDIKLSAEPTQDVEYEWAMTTSVIDRILDTYGYRRP